jgi:hypothetical protein
MMRKYPVRFGRGCSEKGWQQHLAECLPYPLAKDSRRLTGEARRVWAIKQPVIVLVREEVVFATQPGPSHDFQPLGSEQFALLPCSFLCYQSGVRDGLGFASVSV